MEEKKSIWNINSLRTIFSLRNLSSNFFRRIPHAKFPTPNGFTLIEVLITLALIGVMATGIIVALNPVAQFQKTRDAQRKSDLSQIQKAVETYYQDNGKYPPSTADFRIKDLDGDTVAWGGSWQPYMSVLSKDPTSSKKYVYVSTSTDGQTYYLYTNLDRGGNDSQACFSTGAACSNAVNNGVTEECGGNCNYGVSSPNVSP